MVCVSKSTNAVEVEHVIHLADEPESVSPVEKSGRGGRGDERVMRLDGNEEHALQMPEPGLVDCEADQRSVGDDLHLNRVVRGVRAQVCGPT